MNGLFFESVFPNHSLFFENGVPSQPEWHSLAVPRFLSLLVGGFFHPNWDIK